MKLEREIDTVVVDVPIERPTFRRRLSVPLAPLTQEELARRQADAIERAKAREAKFREEFPVTFTIARPTRR